MYNVYDAIIKRRTIRKFKNFASKMDRFIDEYYKTYKNTGCLRVTLRDEIVYEKFIGYADIENQAEFTNKSVFTLYSLSKPFCAMAIMKLKDKGLIDINLHPGTYLYEAKGFSKELTIRHLLNHVSGVPDFDQNTDFRSKYKGENSEQLKSMLLLLSNENMLFEPGTKHHYTNTNFIICALIIEAVSGRKYADYMMEEIFEPLGMKNTYIYDKNLILDGMVKGYEMIDDIITPVERVTEWILGGADVVSTVEDVYCLNRAIKHKLILSADSWKEILTPNKINSMGFGCTFNKWHNKERIVHNGGWTGFRTYHTQIPEDDFDIIILSNSGWGDIRSDISEAIYSAFYGDCISKTDNMKMDEGYIH